MLSAFRSNTDYRVFQIVPLVCFLFLATNVVAQDSPIPHMPADGTLDIAQIETAREAINARDDLPDETRAQILDALREAESAVVARISAENDAEAFNAAFASAPLETARLRAALDEADFGTDTDVDVDADSSLGELEQRLAEESASAATAQARLAELEFALAAQRERRTAIRSRITELQGILEQLSGLLNNPAPPAGNALLTDARRLSAALTRDARRAELIRLEQELLSYDVRFELLRARRDTAEASVDRARQRVDAVTAIVNDERQAEARRAQVEAAAAQLAAADRHPALREIAEGNLALTRELPFVADQIEVVTSTLSAVEAEIEQVEQAMARSQQRLDIGGITQATGRLFVEERRSLPRYSDYRSDLRDRRKTLSDIGLAQVRVEEERRELASIEDRVETVMELVRADVDDPAALDTIRSEANDLLKYRRELLAKASSAYRTYIRLLGDLDDAQKRLLLAADDYRSFLDEHLIWIPNTGPIGVDTFGDVVDALTWLLSPSSWLDALKAAWAGFSASPFEAVLLFLLLFAAIAIQPRLKLWFRRLTARIGKLSTDTIAVTFGAIGIVAVQALPVPLALATVGVAIQRSSATGSFVESSAAALIGTAPFLYNLLVFRVMSAPRGILGRHFDWREENLATIRRQLDRIITVGAPLVFVIIMLLTASERIYRDGLGRLSFTALMILFAAVLWPLGHPRKSVGSSYYGRNPKSWLSRLRWLWFSLDLGIPIALAALALIGYLYTALSLVDKLVETVWLILGLVLAGLVVRRWLALERRKMALKTAVERRKARHAEKELGSEKAATSETESAPAASTPLDLDAVGTQTQKLLQAGMAVAGILGAWSIWSDVLPALNVLDEVALWSQTITVDGAEALVPVSLADVLLALVVAAATTVASRNLPGLMEIALLRHLDLQPGGRYTINTLLRYLVVTAGVVAILNIIGWNWSRIQWLVAALSVGLGFGLQEIVANFVSGLIILFERPVRVGDTVTVGQLTGTVSKVRIRATTITDWDRKEIIVPNKSFITEQVVNWTLSDPITRVVVPVGISYGSDVVLATQVMKDTLQSMPIILDDPPPAVYFMGFGNSSLDFNLYVYSRQLSDRLPLMHAVHSSILSALRENGIEIPFPQRDLHLRSVSESVKEGGWQSSEQKPE